MRHIMFDIDGTLIESFDFDEKCYMDAVQAVLGHSIDNDWSRYAHVSDSGILDQHILEKQLLSQKQEIHENVKAEFIDRINSHLSQTPAKPISGGTEFFAYLKNRNDVSLSIATGGWEETARMKLESAGFDISGISIASSNDHYSRVEIMRLALQRTGVLSDQQATYFGDAAWDKAACKQLGFNFVLVGNRTSHYQTINDFTDVEAVFRLIDGR